MVFQDPYSSLNPRMKVGSAIAEPALVHKVIERSNAARHVEEMLELVGLPASAAERYPRQLSGGQRQRIAIARALSARPSVLIADEPVSALDVSVQAQILNLLARLHRELDLTMVFIAHQLSVVRHISDRVAIMYLGRIVETGPTDRVFDAPQHPYTKALLEAAPHPDPSRRHVRAAVRGDIPSPFDIPSGCRFRTRCPFAIERCETEDPVLRTVAQKHLAACHVLPFRESGASMALPRLEEIDTPALVVDGPTLVTNVREMAGRARGGKVGLWPHSKTHKSLAVAALQREYGIAGLTAATLREAETFAGDGVEDILIAYPPVGPRLRRVVDLSKRIRVRVVLDNADVVDALEDACRKAHTRIGYLWEVECGTGRIGTEPGETAARLIAPVAARSKHAWFAGLMAFAGHAYAADSPAEIGAAAEQEGRAVHETAAALAAEGVLASVLSVGTTPTTHHLEREGAVTEIRPGNYVFYDATQVTLGVVSPERCALSVLATVVARPTPRRLILDAGSKALAAEMLNPRSPGFGFVVGHPELFVARLYEEHTIVTCEEPSAIPVGERLAIVPNHACACVNLHERMLVVENGEVADVWNIDARGWVSR